MKKRPGQRYLVLWSLIMIFFLAELFAFAWCRIQIVKTGYEIEQESRNRKSLLRLRDNLKIEIARLKSPKRLAEIAEKYNLKPPRPEQLVIIK